MTRPSNDTIRNILTGAAIVVSLFALWCSWVSARAATQSALEAKRKADIAIEQFNLNVQNENAAREKARVLELQTFHIHQIVDKWDVSSGKGITFDEIKDQYLQAVHQDGTIPKSAIQDAQLRRILLSLKTANLIYQTFDGSYVTQRSELLFGFGRGYAMENAAQGMLHHLTVSGAKANAELLSFAADRYKLSPEEYYFTLATLKKEGLVSIGEGKVWSIIPLPEVSAPSP